MSGRCQRCGKACEGTLCRPCQAITAGLQAKEQNRPRLKAEQRPEPKEPERKPRRGPAPTKKSSTADQMHRGANRQPLPITQPPAEVVQTFKRVGQLQLHRLGERAHFCCVICRQQKTASLVATTRGNWKKLVCNACYRRLVDAEQGKAKKAPRQSGAKRRLSSSRLRRQNGMPTKFRPATAKREGQALKHRQSAGDSLLGFFRDAGIDAEFGRGGCLWINGSQTEPLAQLPSPETPEWLNVVNEIALKYARDKFISAVEDNARFGDGLRPSLLTQEKGFVIMRGDVRLAVIRAARTSIPHRPGIRENFLTPGPHWQQVANVVRGAEAELVADRRREQEANAAEAAAEVWQRRTSTPRRYDQLPNYLGQQLIDTCLDASRRIRLERQVAYGRPVVLECDIGELTLLPIAGTTSGLRMPFRLSNGMETLKGELALGDHDPLPLLIGEIGEEEDAADPDEIEAWTYALRGFADATCIEYEPTRQGRPAFPMSPRRPATRTLPRKQRWPRNLRNLEPVGDWTRYRGSFVAGHRRRLPDDQHAGDEARDLARQVGIILHPHETWVRWHIRGVPHGTEMRFRWHAPTELNSSVGP